MTDEEFDPEHDRWIYILRYDVDHGPTRGCAVIAMLILIGWALTQVLN